MDTMTFTKVAAGVLSAWLVLLLAKWGGEGVYHAEAHGEASYVIEVAGAETASAEPEIPFEELLASASADKGSKVFRKCTACHKAEDGANATGPFLYGVVGRDINAAAGFASYSGSLTTNGAVWTPENLNDFLTKPSEWAPGTSMSFAGIKKPEDRANLIAYLDSLDD